MQFSIVSLNQKGATIPSLIKYEKIIKRRGKMRET